MGSGNKYYSILLYPLRGRLLGSSSDAPIMPPYLACTALSDTGPNGMLRCLLLALPEGGPHYPLDLCWCRGQWGRDSSSFNGIWLEWLLSESLLVKLPFPGLLSGENWLSLNLLFPPAPLGVSPVVGFSRSTVVEGKQNLSESLWCLSLDCEAPTSPPPFSELSYACFIVYNFHGCFTKQEE